MRRTKDLEDLYNIHLSQVSYSYTYLSTTASQDTQNNLLLLYMQNGRASSKVLLSFTR
jgi:hypothetical protein